MSHGECWLGFLTLFSPLTYVGHRSCVFTFAKKKLQVAVWQVASWGEIFPTNVWINIFVNPKANFSEQLMVVSFRKWIEFSCGHNFFELILLKSFAQFYFNSICAYPAQFCMLVKNHIRLSLQLIKARFKLLIRDTNEQDKNHTDFWLRNLWKVFEKSMKCSMGPVYY